MIFYQQILVEFNKLTGFPILLNTYFNMNSEPMVNNPNDAINTFLKSGLDTMIIEDFLVKKL